MYTNQNPNHQCAYPNAWNRMEMQAEYIIKFFIFDSIRLLCIYVYGYVYAYIHMYPTRL